MTSISKIAVVATGIAMAASLTLSVAPAAAQSNADLQAQITSLLATIQSLQSQLNGSQASSTASVTFTRDLTIGSKGADVTALQTWLIGKGYTLAAGATGYFGAQTKAALAAYQTAKGIAPAAGYFGPMTRASVSAMGGSTTTTTTTTTTTGSTALSGTEATLSNFQFNGGVGTMHEGDTNVALANTKFDVQNGDINVQRVDLEFQATNASLDVHPWKYITSITAWDGSTKLGTVDTSNSNSWNDNLDDANHSASAADVYKISITGLSDVVKAGSTNHQISFTANVNSTLDSSTQQAQSFRVDIPDQGLRAVDAVGIQQYIGGTSNYITLSFNSADNGKITVSEDSSNPATGIIVVNSSNVTQNVPVFAFNLRNTNSGATKIDSLLIDVATSSYATTTSIVNNATLVVGGQSYSGTISNVGGSISGRGSIYFRNVNFTVAGNSSVVGTLKVDLASQSNYSALSSPSLTFSLPTTGITAEGVNSGNTLTSGNLTGGAQGKTQTLATSGIAVVANSASVVSSAAASGVSAYNTYTIKFDVSAVENDAFVPTTASTTASSTTGVIFTLAGSSFTGSTTASLSSTADTASAGYYKVPAGSTRSFTLTVVLKPGTGQSGLYEVDLSSVYFSTTAVAPTQHYTIDSTNSGFKTNPTYSAN